MEFQRFEEETQQQTYQQPVGFNPANSVSQGNAIRQQYQQTQASKQFYDNSISLRNDIRQSNSSQAAANFANNTSNFVLDKLSDFAPTLGKMYQEGVARDRKAREQEGYVEEFQRVYDNGLSETEQAENAEQASSESLTRNAYNTAATESYASNGSPEVARLIRMKDPYKRMGAARAYAEKVAQNDPTQLQEALRKARAEKGSPLTSVEVNNEVAKYNGANWVASGLTQFKPSFLGQKYWSQLRQNQTKVASAAVKENQIEQGSIDRVEALDQYLVDAKVNPTLALQTLFSTTTTTLNARGGAFGRKESWDAWKTKLINSDMSMEDIRGILANTKDPVIEGKSVLEARPEYALAIEKGKYQQKKDAKTIEDFAVQQQADEAQEVSLDNMPDNLDSLGQQQYLYKEAQRLRDLYPSASLTRLQRELNTTSGLGRIEREQSLDAIAAAQGRGKVPEDMLNLPGLTERDRLRIEGLPEFEDNALRKEREGLTKEAEKSFGNALKGVEGAYTGADAQGNLVPSPEGNRIVEVMKRELQDKIAEVRQEKPEASESVIYREAASRTIKWARDEQGLGKTDKEAPGGLFATSPGKGFNADLFGETADEKFDRQVQQINPKDPTTYIPGDRSSVDKRTNDFFSGKFLPTPLEQAAMRKTGLPFTDLLNIARKNMGLPVIPPSRFEQAIQDLPEGAQQVLFDPTSAAAAKQRIFGQMEQPPAIVQPSQGAQAQAPTASSNFNADAVAAEFGTAQVAPLLPAIQQAGQSTETPAPLIAALIGTESSFRPRPGPMTRYGQAQGPMQIVPMWHPEMPLTYEGQIEYGANYLASLKNMTQGVHSSAPPAGTWARALFLYSGDHNRPYSASDRKYVQDTMRRAYSYGMSTLLSDAGMMRPTFAKLMTVA